MVERDYGDRILRLQDMAIGRIINQDHILQTTIDHPQILQVIPPFQGAVLPIEPIRNPLLLRVQVVQHHIGIGGCTRREDYYLCDLGQLLQELAAIGSDADAGLLRRMGTARWPPRSRGKFNLTV